MVLINLFVAFFRVGFLSIGGGYVLYPLIEKEVVKNYQWMTGDQFVEFTGIIQGIPGAISIKFATLTGYRVAGIPGVLAANIGVILPPALIIILLISIMTQLQDSPHFGAFLKAVAFATAGLIAYFLYTSSAALSWNLAGLIIAGLVFFVLLFTSLHPGLLILIMGFAGIFIF
ncbi:MAG: chromate transporter [Bacillota bacterium]